MPTHLFIESGIGIMNAVSNILFSINSGCLMFMTLWTWTLKSKEKSGEKEEIARIAFGIGQHEYHLLNSQASAK